MATFTISDGVSSDSDLNFGEAVNRIADWFRDVDEWQDGVGSDELHAAVEQAIQGVEQPEQGGERELQRYADAICNAVAEALGHNAFHGHGNYAVSAAEQAGISLTVETDDDDDEPVSLRDWNNEDPKGRQVTYLWICGVGCPAGMDLFHNVDTDVDEDYCDFAELELLHKLWDLVGTIDDNGTWCWDGEGHVTDSRGNMIYNIKARR